MHDDMTAVVVWLDTAAGNQQVRRKQGMPPSREQGSNWTSWWPFSSAKAAAQGASSLQPARAQLSFSSPHPSSGAFESPGHHQTDQRS